MHIAAQQGNAIFLQLLLWVNISVSLIYFQCSNNWSSISVLQFWLFLNHVHYSNTPLKFSKSAVTFDQEAFNIKQD